MKTLKSTTCIFVLFVLLPAAVAIGQAKNVASVERTATFFDVNTFGCIHLNVNQFEKEAFLKAVEQRQNLLSPFNGPGDAEAFVHTTKMIAEVAGRLKANGASDIYIPIGLSTLANESPLIIVAGDVKQAFDGILMTKKLGEFTLVGSQEALTQFDEATNKPQRTDLTDLMKKIGRENVLTVIIKPSSDHRRVLRETVSDLPAPFEKLNGPLIAEAVEHLAFSVQSFEEPRVEMVIQGSSDQAVQKFSKSIYEGLVSAIGDSAPNGAAIVKMTKAIAKLVSTKTENGRFSLMLPADGLDEFETSIQPGVNEWRKKAAVVMTQNQVRQLAIAFHNSADMHKGSLPAMANYSENRKPLLSWRVHALQFTEYLDLYEQFHLDEPWDSPHNKNLIPKMPSVYSVAEGWLTKAQVDTLNKEGKTIFVLPVGEGMFAQPNRVKFQEFKDGVANTIMIMTAPADKAVIWTKPDDLRINGKDPNSSVFDRETTQAVVSLGDASTQVIQSTISSKFLKGWLTLAGGELIPSDR